MINRAIRTGVALAWALALTPTWAAAQEAEKASAPAPSAAVSEPAQKLGGAVREQLASDAEAMASQKRIDSIDDETLKLLTEYRRAVADAESYTAYAQQLEAQVQAQNEEMASINQQLGEIETTSREVLPLMQRMLDTLAQFVDLDLPFLLEERKNRVALLESMMARADVTLSEKYRRIVEAYQVEMDYGRTLEAYEGKLGQAADARTVQFLRVGRVALLYQTLDGKETGYWDQNQKTWVVDNDYGHGFKEGIAVAKKTRAPEMLLVPVPAPKEAKS
ncbi:MAG: DUF3450 domain-containing protein [Candidatus Limnocylindria bacterium]